MQPQPSEIDLVKKLTGLNNYISTPETPIANDFREKRIREGHSILREFMVEFHIQQCDHAFDCMEGTTLEEFKKWETIMIYEQDLLCELGVIYHPDTGSIERIKMDKLGNPIPELK